MIWNDETEVGGASFYLSDSNYSISIVGCCATSTIMDIIAEVKALMVVIEAAIVARLWVQHLFIAIHVLITALNSNAHQSV